MKSSDFVRLAPYQRGRAHWLQEGISWSSRASAPEDGWHWWTASQLWIRSAHPYEVTDRPLKLVQKSPKACLALAEDFLEGDWLRCWCANGVAWVVEAASGPTPPRRAAAPVERTWSDRIGRGGGRLLRVEPQGTLFALNWRAVRGEYRSLVDAGGNVVQAGMCLSGQDRLQDLTSLVSLIVRKEKEDENYGRWSGYPGGEYS